VLVLAQLVETFIAFYKTRRFITAFTRLTHNDYPEPDESSSSLNVLRMILMLSSHLPQDLTRGIFSVGFPAKIFVRMTGLFKNCACPAHRRS